MESQASYVDAVTISTTVMMTVFVLARFIARGLARRFVAHDGVMILAYVCPRSPVLHYPSHRSAYQVSIQLLAVAVSVSVCVSTHAGLGLHHNDISPTMRPMLNRCIYIFSVLYNPALMAVKTALLLFYLTILTRRRAAPRLATYATLIVTNVAGLALTLLNAFRCKPVSYAFWRPDDMLVSCDTGHCKSLLSLYLASAPVNIITSLAIFILPIPSLMRMRLPVRTRAVLGLTFGLGAFATVVDIVRVAYLQNAAVLRLTEIEKEAVEDAPWLRHVNATAVWENWAQHHVTLRHDDFSWYASKTFMWSAVEINTGMACACIPLLKPLVDRLAPGCFSRRRRSTASTNNRPPIITGRQPLSDKNSNMGDGKLMTVTDFLQSENKPSTRASPIPFYDFVAIRPPRSLLTLTRRESLGPIAAATVLLFLTGFAYGFLGVLNHHFQRISGITHRCVTVLHATYFAGTLTGCPLGYFIMRRPGWGFKRAFVIGLGIYALGVLLFWPSAVLISYATFLVSNLVIGTGIFVVETACTPFVVLCGSPEYAELRLGLASTFQAVASMISPIVAIRGLFHHHVTQRDDPYSLIQTQWTYLGIAFFCFILAVVFVFIPLPDVDDSDLADLAAERSANRASLRLGGRRVKLVHLTLGVAVFTQFFYYGGQEVMDQIIWMIHWQIVPHAPLTPFDHRVVGSALFAGGRLLFAASSLVYKPRHTLFVVFGGTITFSLLFFLLHHHPISIQTACLLIYFFASAIPTLVQPMALRGQGRGTKVAAALLILSQAGGGLFPGIQTALMDDQYIHEMNTSHEWKSRRWSFIVLPIAFSLAALFLLYVYVATFVGAPIAQTIDPVQGEFGAAREAAQEQRARMEGNNAALAAGGGSVGSTKGLSAYANGGSLCRWAWNMLVATFGSGNVDEREFVSEWYLRETGGGGSGGGNGVGPGLPRTAGLAGRSARRFARASDPELAELDADDLEGEGDEDEDHDMDVEMLDLGASREKVSPAAAAMTANRLGENSSRDDGNHISVTSKIDIDVRDAADKSFYDNDGISVSPVPPPSPVFSPTRRYEPPSLTIDTNFAQNDSTHLGLGPRYGATGSLRSGGGGGSGNNSSNSAGGPQRSPVGSSGGSAIRMARAGLTWDKNSRYLIAPWPEPPLDLGAPSPPLRPIGGRARDQARGGLGAMGMGAGAAVDIDGVVERDGWRWMGGGANGNETRGSREGGGSGNVDVERHGGAPGWGWRQRWRWVFGL